MPPGALVPYYGGWRVVGAAAAGMAPRSSSVRYPQVFCPTPVSEAQERVRALTKVCQAFQRLMAGVRRRLFTRGLNESIGEGGRGVSQYVPANAP